MYDKAVSFPTFGMSLHFRCCVQRLCFQYTHCFKNQRDLKLLSTLRLAVYCLSTLKCNCAGCHSGHMATCCELSTDTLTINPCMINNRGDCVFITGRCPFLTLTRQFFSEAGHTVFNQSYDNQMKCCCDSMDTAEFLSRSFCLFISALR